MAEKVNPFFDFMFRPGEQLCDCVSNNPNQTESQKRVERGNIAKIPHQVRLCIMHIKHFTIV